MRWGGPQRNRAKLPKIWHCCPRSALFEGICLGPLPDRGQRQFPRSPKKNECLPHHCA